MNNLFKGIVFSILAIAVIAIAIFLYSQAQRNYKSIFDAIPPSSIAIFEARGTGPAWIKLTNTDGFWSDLLEFEQFKRIESQLNFLDSLAKGKTAFYEKLSQKPMALALHSTEDGLGYLFVIETAGGIRLNEVKSMLNKYLADGISYHTSSLHDFAIGHISDSVSKATFNFSITNGLFIGSFDLSLLELGLTQLQSDANILDDQAFAHLRETTGRLVDGYLYTHSGRLAKVLQSGSAQPYKSFVDDAFTDFSGWSALDLMLKPGEVLLNGYTEVSEPAKGYLAAIAGQKPIPTRLFNILPFTTRLLVHFGMDDYVTFNQKSVNQSNIDELNNKYGFDFRQSLVHQIDGEVAFALGNGNPADRAFFVARVKNQQAVDLALRKLAGKVSGNNQPQRSGNISYFHINAKDILADVFGPVFKPVEGFWYAHFDNYLLIANNPQTLEEVSRLYNSGRTLDLNDNFKAFANNLSYQSNILFYTNLRASSDILNQYLDEQLMIHLNKHHEVISNFEGIAVQFSRITGLIYTNIYIKYNPHYREEGLISWRTKLDAAVTGKPAIIEDHVTGKYNVVVFDVNKNMHLVSPDGDIYWSKQINEEPISEVFAVDFYKNGRIQYLFNTPNYLYLVDRNGDNVANFPVRLRSQATSGISVFDYSNNRDYRILVSGVDKTTYNYDIKGREVEGWQKPRSQEIVTKPIERLVADGRDYIIITDNSGNIRIVDRRGRTRINPRGTIDKALHSNFYINRTNSRGILLTTNKTGQLLYVATNGSLATTDFGAFNPQHFFLYEDFNQNSSIDFIYLDGNKLSIFDRFRNVLFEHQFSNAIISKPVFFNVTRTNRLLGIVSEASKEIFLIDKEGRMITSSGLVGETPFAVGSLHNDNEINLITGVGEMLYNYVIY